MPKSKSEPKRRRGSVVGEQACFDCGVVGPIRWAQNDLAYHFCPSCGAKHYYGAAKSDAMLEGSEGGLGTAPKPAPVTDPKPDAPKPQKNDPHDIWA